ncbi:MAG: PhzF family phenazine biosynthesis protein [Flavobacteriales bacterium]|jgi:predicted PhzF superfamily epimerase YddE/YHI9|nr:PhzF family phenazine biosynthesis protein [Flavobacteriales bacterium]MBT3964557.1 PhzF family phenazine biosynthesis protein [Flavobacteriales bacterium]MBT4930802.1 PhzF family phenazine biosynthesis protein [Flavobacteriales bacterium]MBT5132135.1 PhzF family phenazine biosynthesis protein [Flavobacteriales bacterium]MBT5977020.1 PhzF family phenazine biosynthesis protein [Flavobacteriales bacterium]
MNRGDFILVNAFTGHLAKGNQCCVLLLDDLADSQRLQDLAADFNLPATSFIRRMDAHNYQVRWFAPEGEINLCGHGTIAASAVLFEADPSIDEISFHYGEVILLGKREVSGVAITGTPILSAEVEIPSHVLTGFKGKAAAYYTSSNKDIVLFENADDVCSMNPDWNALRKSNTFAYVVTATGDDSDFVSRVFLPYVSFLEDQATGSAHMLLTPFWSERLAKNEMKAHQLSKRGGRMSCGYHDNLVTLTAETLIFGQESLIP